jgi:hypothetical protein
LEFGKLFDFVSRKGADNMLLFGSKMYGNSEGLKPSIKITDAKKIARLMGYLGTDGLKKKYMILKYLKPITRLPRHFITNLLLTKLKNNLLIILFNTEKKNQ